jgi:hypothetical protein
MRRYLAPLFILLALLAASCGGDSSPDVATLDQGVERLVANAAEQSADIDSVRFSIEMVMGGLADLGGEEVAVSISGASTADGSRGEMTMDMSAMMGALGESDPMLGDAGMALFTEPVEIRYTDGRVYMSSSFLSFLFPVDTPWITFEDTGDGAATDMGLDTETVDPQELLVLLRGLGDDAEILGTEELDGITTTHVRGRFSAANVVGSAADLESLEEMLGELGSTGTAGLDDAVFDVDVWIGDDGIVRRLRFAVDDLAAMDPTAEPGAYMEVTLDLFDVGEPVEISIPPADQVTDIEELFGGAFFS